MCIHLTPSVWQPGAFEVDPGDGSFDALAGVTVVVVFAGVNVARLIDFNLPVINGVREHLKPF